MTQHFELQIVESNNNINASWIYGCQFNLWYMSLYLLLCYLNMVFANLFVLLHVLLWLSNLVYVNLLVPLHTTFIFKSGFCKSIRGVGGSPFTCLIFISCFNFYRFSFKPIFCNKSFKLDLFSSTIISRSTQEL